MATLTPRDALGVLPVRAASSFFKDEEGDLEGLILVT